MSPVVLAAGAGTHWGVIAAVLVAASIGGLNVVQVILTRRALGAARDATREALKARIDQQAPRVVVRLVHGDPQRRAHSGDHGRSDPVPGAPSEQ